MGQERQGYIYLLDREVSHAPENLENKVQTKEKITDFQVLLGMVYYPARHKVRKMKNNGTHTSNLNNFGARSKA